MADEQKTVSIGPLGVPKHGLGETASIAVTGVRNATVEVVNYGTGTKYIGRVMGGSLTVLTGVVDVADAAINGTGQDVIVQTAGIFGSLYFGGKGVIIGAYLGAPAGPWGAGIGAVFVGALEPIGGRLGCRP